MTSFKPWLENYDPGVPHKIDYADICIHELLHMQAINNPRQTAIIDGENCVDFENLYRLVLNFARNLAAEGLRPGERVGVCLPNSLEFTVAFYGVLTAGGIVAALNPMFPHRELEFQIKKVEPRFVVITDERLHDFRELQKVTSLEKLILVPHENQESDLDVGIPASQPFNSFQSMIKDLKTEITLPGVNPDQAAVFQFSGGTSGTPKAAIGTHRNIVSNVTQFRHWLVNLEEGKETFLVAIPLYHVYGMVLGLNLGIAMGARIVFLRDPRNIKDLLKLIQLYKVSYFPAVPSTFHMINQYPGVNEGKYDLSMIKACISGSAPLPDTVRTLFEKNTGGHLVEGYGLSEAPTATHCNPILGENRKGSIGLPLPDVECRIVRMDEGDVDVVPGEAGELLIKAPQVMQGYFRDDDESVHTLRNGWLHTGDIACMDEDGYFYLLGRLKELIKVHGLQVWPAEVEEVILQYPGVKECVAAGVPDQCSGERVKVWIVAQESEVLTINELRLFCKGKLAGYKIPAEMEFIDSIPRSPVGKVLRRELVRLHLEKQK